MRNSLFIGMLLVASVISIPSSAYAETSRRGSSAYQSKINKLDDDAVKNIPIPILFGVTLSDITPNYGDPRDGGSRTHEGLDIMSPEGSPIITPTEAVVIRTGNDSGSGKYVTTANPGGENFIYMHLSEVLVKSGSVLKVGDLIGYVGDTGNASGGPAHLHFEIRKDRKPTDPYLRIKEELTLTEKIELLEDVLDDAKDEDELIEFLVGEYFAEFYQADREKIRMPKAVLKELKEKGDVPARNLDVGSKGADVNILQDTLIVEGFLDLETPTGYFGSLTKEALRRYQEAHSLTPADGYYGEDTRSYIAQKRESTKTMTREEMLVKIEELTELIKKLKAQQNQ